MFNELPIIVEEAATLLQYRVSVAHHEYDLTYDLRGALHYYRTLIAAS